ncbi:Chromate resistance protein ChrB [Microlunatus kandeliicorticis]|uniref:Chromate resistance protein ChrB n=1 Tax=Microlunatus kandeliicorticis TaxID=1759536 RepID=UPI002E2B26E1|nr:Chromate resistance protein ChrB [Microlunatus kandeliicorticis]
MLLARLPNEPARHRMAVWRELRRAGAILIGTSTWAMPDVPAGGPLLDRVRELTDRAGGSLVALGASGYAPRDAERLLQRYHDARRDEWTEFEADCDKYLEEIAKEQRIRKFTLGELEEEEQSLDRLRRWYRDLRRRDVLGTPGASSAAEQLKQCEATFDSYAEQVYTAVGSPTTGD